MGVESGELCSRHMDWFARNQPSSGSGSDISRRKTHVSVLSCAFLLLVYLGFTCQENAYLFRTIRWASSSLGILGEHLSPGIKSHPLTDATVVTAYYPLSQGPKHSLKDYRTWMENFLPHVEAPIIIYLPADEELQATVRDLRGNLPLAIQTVDLWDLPPVVPFQEAFRTWQHEIDPEWKWHAPELYAIWNSKPWMLHEATKANAFKSRHFVWADIGAWRHKPYRTWPSGGRLMKAFQNSTERMLVSIVSFQGNGRHSVQAGFFGGLPSTIAWWTEAYYALLNQTVAAKKFAGSEQTLMTELLYRHPQRFLVLQSDSAPFGDPWFFFEPYLAAPKDILPQLASKDGWKEGVSRNVSVMHDPRLVVVGEQIVGGRRRTK